MNEKLLNNMPTLRQRIWYYLTLWRPVTKYEMLNLQSSLVVILEGIRSNDMQHYQIEKLLETELLKLKTKSSIKQKIDNEKVDEMYG